MLKVPRKNGVRPLKYPLTCSGKLSPAVSFRFSPCRAKIVPGLVASPPLAWKVATSPPQRMNGTSSTPPAATSPTLTSPIRLENGSWALRFTAAKPSATIPASRIRMQD